jgi:hypothetical protein
MEDPDAAPATRVDEGGRDGRSDGKTDAGADSGAPAPDGALDANGTPVPTVHSGPCPVLAVHAGTMPDGFASDEFAWADSRCAPRTAALVRNDAADPTGYFGGYLRELTFQLAAGGGTRTVKGVAATRPGTDDVQPGWGYTVNHFASDDTSSRKFAGAYRTVFALPFHAVHEFTTTELIGGSPVAVTIRWFFAVGRDHPVWSVTYDATGAGSDAVSADSRAPYGELDFAGGDPAANVDGVAWGDHYRFTTTGSPVTADTGWDYGAPNTVPFVLEWSSARDAEMGAVQTVPYSVHEAGGPGLSGSWGSSQAGGPMPDPTTWPYQLNQYELPYTTTSKRLGWGTSYGAVGQASYTAIDGTTGLTGYPYQSYSVTMVVGTHAAAPVMAVVAAMEAAAKARLTADVGEVVARGPAGVGRTDAVDFQPAGYDPVYGTWDVKPDGGRAHLTFTVAPGTSLVAPIVVLRAFGRSTLPTLRKNGAVLDYGIDAFPSFDAVSGDLWVTLAGSLDATATVDFD